MPAYEYLCEACGKRFEKRQKMSDPEVEACPACSGKVKRLISGGAGVIANGGQSAPCGAGACCAAEQMGCCMGGGCAH